jgi:hypothetical protein
LTTCRASRPFTSRTLGPRAVGTLAWTVEQTLDHLVDVFVWYAVQRASAATMHTADDAAPAAHASSDDRLAVVKARASLLLTLVGVCGRLPSSHGHLRSRRHPVTRCGCKTSREPVAAPRRRGLPACLLDAVGTAPVG